MANRVYLGKNLSPQLLLHFLNPQISNTLAPNIKKSNKFVIQT